MMFYRSSSMSRPSQTFNNRSDPLIGRITLQSCSEQFYQEQLIQIYHARKVMITRISLKFPERARMPII